MPDPNRLSAAAAVALALAGCAPAAPPPRAPAAPLLPPLPASQLTPAVPAAPRGSPADPLAAYPPGRPVTLSASEVNVRALLPALAEAAGIGLVIGREVEGTVSVNLADVPALEALRAVLAAAGLSLVSGPPAAPWGPVVFYTLPVDVEEASAAMIEARFGVSPGVAAWIVEQRRR